MATSSEAPAGSVGRPWVRTVYLYLLALLGLILLTIGGVRLVDLGLKAFVFTQAEEEDRVAFRQPPMPWALERAERIGRDGASELTPEETAMVRQWIGEYQTWRERSERVDPIVSRRQRTASSSLALILLGLPLYLYHWGLIRRENARR